MDEKDVEGREREGGRDWERWKRREKKLLCVSKAEVRAGKIAKSILLIYCHVIRPVSVSTFY